MDVTSHLPSFHPQPSAPGTPWQPRDQQQKRGFVPGEGEAREGIQGPPPGPRMCQDFETLEPGYPGGWAELPWQAPVPICPLSPAGAASCPSRFPPGLHDLYQCLSAMAVEVKLSPVSCPGLFLLLDWLPLGKSKNQGEWRGVPIVA